MNLEHIVDTVTRSDLGPRVVHKYPIPGVEAALVLPTTSTIAHFGEQRGTLTAWIDRPATDEAPTEVLELVIVGTGHPTPDGTYRHAGSVIVAGGDFVFHLYARTRTGS